MPAKLPAYYEKYFDEKFDNVDKRLKSIDAHLKKVNANVAKNKDRGCDNQRKIKVLGIALIAGSFVWIKESRDMFIQTVRLLLGL